MLKFPLAYASWMAKNPSPKPTKTKTPSATSKEVSERYALMDRTIRQTGFQIDELESALGLYMVGFHFGWRVLYLVHSKRTIAKYETILGVKISEIFPEYGPDADRTNAYKLIQNVSNFWKFVSGDEKTTLQIDKRSLVE